MKTDLFLVLQRKKIRTILAILGTLFLSQLTGCFTPKVMAYGTARKGDVARINSIYEAYQTPESFVFCLGGILAGNAGHNENYMLVLPLRNFAQYKTTNPQSQIVHSEELKSVQLSVPQSVLKDGCENAKTLASLGGAGSRSLPVSKSFQLPQVHEQDIVYLSAPWRGSRTEQGVYIKLKQPLDIPDSSTDPDLSGIRQIHFQVVLDENGNPFALFAVPFTVVIDAGYFVGVVATLPITLPLAVILSGVK